MPANSKIFSPRSILEILQKQGAISPEEADIVSKKAKDNRQIENILLRKNICNEEEIAKAYSVYYNLPFVHLKGKNIPYTTLSEIDEDAAGKYRVVAYEKLDHPKTLKLAVANPSRLQEKKTGIIAKIKKDKGIDLKLAITTEEDIDWAIQGYHRGQLNDEIGLHPSAKKQINEEIRKTPKSKPAEDGVKVKINQKPKLEPTSKIMKNMPLPQAKLKYPHIDLRKILIPYEFLTKLPYDIASKYQMIVFEAPKENLVKIAMVDPYDQKIRQIIKYIESRNNVQVMKYITTKKDVDYALQGYQRGPMPKPAAPIEGKGEVPEIRAEEIKTPETGITQPKTQEKTSAAESMEESNLDVVLKNYSVKNTNDLVKIIKTGNVPIILAATLSLAITMRASDIHLEAGTEDLRLRYRIDGVLGDILKMPLALHAPLLARIKILAKLKIDEQRIPQDGRFDVTLKNKEIDLRISTMPTVHGEKAVLRILDKSAGVMTLEQLGIAGQAFEILVQNVEKPYGIILATGPTGSGKSTTLYAILNRISTPAINIITLEDPVEYEIPGINQCQVVPKIGFSFAEGLRSVLRQDPNVIMVGEIRDKETAEMATHAALTGHLVLTTLHTNDAAGALPRLINMGIEPFLITSAINAVVAQRLVRRICKECNQEVKIPEALLGDVRNELKGLKAWENKPLKFYKGKGCSNCSQGFSGRVGIFEVMPMSNEIERLAVERQPSHRITAESKREGMVTMKQDGIIKALKGITSLDEVLRVTSNK